MERFRLHWSLFAYKLVFRADNEELGSAYAGFVLIRESLYGSELGKATGMGRCRVLGNAPFCRGPRCQNYVVNLCPWVWVLALKWLAHILFFVSFCCCCCYCCLRAPSGYSGVTLSSALSNYSWQFLGDHMGFWESSLAAFKRSAPATVSLAPILLLLLL